MSGLVVRAHTNSADFFSLREHWDGLFESVEEPSPFISHTWLSCWWKHFGDDKSLSVLTVWDEHTLIGALPLMRTTIRILKVFKFQCLHSLTNPHSPDFNLLCRECDLDRVVSAIHDYLEERSASWSILLLERLIQSSAASTVLSERFQGKRFFTAIKPWEGSYYIPIAGSFQDYFFSLNKAFRLNRQNKNNRLRAMGPVSFQAIGDYDRKAVEIFYGVENTGWKRENRSAVISRPETAGFYYELAEQFAQRRQFLLAILSVAGTAISSIFGLAFNRRFYQLKIGTNYSFEHYSKVSPGEAIEALLIQHCFDHHLAGFDFCGPFAPFEKHWTKTVRPRSILTIYNLHKPSVRFFLLLKRLLLPTYRSCRKYLDND